VVAFRDLKMSYRSRKAGGAVVGGVEVFRRRQALVGVDGGELKSPTTSSALLALAAATLKR
jgi:hypothetical protein